MLCLFAVGYVSLIRLAVAMNDENYPSGRFGGDMDRNEVEMDLNKFMAMVQEIGALKDKIRDLEDVTKGNPYLAEVRAEFEALRLRRKLAADYRERSGRRATELRDIAEFAYQEDELGILELLDSYRVSQRARLRLLELQAAAKLAEVDFDRAIGKEMLP